MCARGWCLQPRVYPEVATEFTQRGWGVTNLIAILWMLFSLWGYLLPWLIRGFLHAVVDATAG